MIETLKQAWNELLAPGSAFAWSTREVRGTPLRVFDTAPADMRSVWELSAQFAERPYIVFEDETLTYGEVHAMVRSLAHRLVDPLGVGAGDRVAIAMRNYPEWVIAYWATVAVGACAVGMNAWWTPAELEYAINDSRPKVLIADDERLARVSEVLPSVRAEAPLHVVAVRSERDVPADASHWTDHVTADDAPDDLPAAAIHPDDDMCIFYTSGTTGFPKGAQLTHRGSVHNVMHLAFANTVVATAAARLPAADHDDPNDASGTSDDGGPGNTSDASGTSNTSGGDDGGNTSGGGDDGANESAGAAQPGTQGAPLGQTAIMAPTPLFHVTANNCVLHPATMAGAKVVMMHRWDAARAIALIEREGVNSFTGVPTMAREILAHRDWHIRDVSSLTTLGGGGAAIQPDLVDKIETAPGGVRPATGYGLTETHGVITAVSNAFYVAKPTSVGPVMPTFEYKVIDDAGIDVPAGERGELCVRGPAVVKGYLNRPAETAEAIVDGWFRTGDVVYVDSDDFVHIVDRAKDIVLRGGENVYCAEVEAAVYEHPGVAEAAVFAVPDERLGETVGVAIHRGEGATLDESELAAHLAPLIAEFKRPEHVWFVTEPLPRNANGKFVKRHLKDQLIAAPSTSC